MRGLGRDRLGVTEAQIEAFGELVLELSHNLQVRRGDPVRTKDFEAVERQRAALGLTDAEIAARIGLARDQVTWIRNAMEHRRFRRRRYHRLLALGGGRRYRAGRGLDPGEQPAPGDAAMRLRSALAFPAHLARRYVENGWWADDTLSGWLERHAGERPDAPALVEPDGATPWAELARRVEARAAALAALGVGPGDVVAIQLPNVAAFLEIYLAAARLGAVTSTLYLSHREAEMEALLGFSRARVAVVPAAIGDFPAGEVAARLAARLPDLEHVVCAGEPVPGTLPLDDLTGDPAAIARRAPPVAADPFLLLFTSGTTSAPKAVPLTYHNMLSNARLSAPEHGVGPDDVVLSAAPFGHLYALYSFHLALATGAATALLPAFSPPALAEALAALRPTFLFAAPAHLAACLGAELLDASRCESLRLVVMSGSKVPPALARSLAERLPNGRVTQLWGMTETQAGLYTRPDDPIDVVARSAGRPSPGTEVRVVAEDGTELGPGEEGELEVRGCLLFPGYLDNPEANRAAFTGEGWFRTGDLAVRDEAGNVSITGRLKDVINRGGVKYNPAEVEALLDAHPKVAQSAIVPVPDEVLGERACCFVVPAGGEPPTLAELCEHLLARGVSKVKLPERLEVIAGMPMTPTRKIIKGRLRPGGG